MQTSLSRSRPLQQDCHQQETEKWEECLIQHRVWGWKHTYPLQKRQRHNKCPFPWSLFPLLFLRPGSLSISLMISPASCPCLNSYPLKKTEIGRLTGESIIYLRLSSKSYQIPGFRLYTEKQSSPSTGNTPSLGVNRPLQTACSTYWTSKGCENRANTKRACCVPLKGRLFLYGEILSLWKCVFIYAHTLVVRCYGPDFLPSMKPSFLKVEKWPESQCTSLSFFYNSRAICFNWKFWFSLKIAYADMIRNLNAI